MVQGQSEHPGELGGYTRFRHRFFKFFGLTWYKDFLSIVAHFEKEIKELKGEILELKDDNLDLVRRLNEFKDEIEALDQTNDKMFGLVDERFTELEKKLETPVEVPRPKPIEPRHRPARQILRDLEARDRENYIKLKQGGNNASLSRAEAEKTIS